MSEQTRWFIAAGGLVLILLAFDRIAAAVQRLRRINRETWTRRAERFADTDHTDPLDKG